MIKTAEHYAHAYLYVYRNPIKHCVIEKVEQYKWSTIHSWNRKFLKIIQVRKNGFEAFIPQSKSEQIPLINQKVSADYNTNVKKALRRCEFTFPRNHSSKGRLNFRNMLRLKKSPGT